MNRLPKNKIDENVNDEDTCAGDDSNRPSNHENSSGDVWQKDIEKHDYYYDDSHGYEIYNPEDDEDTDED